MQSMLSDLQSVNALKPTARTNKGPRALGLLVSIRFINFFPSFT